MSENHRIFLLIGNSKLRISDPETLQKELRLERLRAKSLSSRATCTPVARMN